MEDHETLIKKKSLKSNEDIEYNFEFRRENDYILFIIIEKNVFSPFTFEGKLTLDEFMELHEAFKSCDNLEEVLRHLNNLYQGNRIKLVKKEKKDERYLSFNIFNISEEQQTNEFTLKLEMTNEKDYALKELYNRQKEQLELFKKIKSLVEKNKIENKFTESILKSLEKCGSKIIIN